MTLFFGPLSKVSVLTYPRLKQSVFITMRFQKTPLLKPCLKASVFISISGRFSVVDGRKCIRVVGALYIQLLLGRNIINNVQKQKQNRQ